MEVIGEGGMNDQVEAAYTAMSRAKDVMKKPYKHC
jgi:hypothetical protein